MANTKYESLLPYVLTEVPGCSDPLAEQSIRDAVIEFIARSMVWTSVPDAQDVRADQIEYDIDLPPGASLVQIKSVSVLGCSAPLEARTTDWLDANVMDWRTATGTPRYYTQIDDSAFLLVPVPDTTARASLIVALTVKPARNSTAFPGWINERYQKDMMAGAKGELMLKQKTAWYNPQQALTYMAQFNQAIVSARADAAISLVRASMRTTSQH